MTNPTRIQLSRARRFSLDTASRAVNGLPARKVDRTTPFGNPFRMGKNGGTPEERAIVVQRHREWLLGPSMEARVLRRRIRSELAGVNVACWCPAGAACHADAILEVLRAS